MSTGEKMTLLSLWEEADAATRGADDPPERRVEDLCMFCVGALSLIYLVKVRGPGAIDDLTAEIGAILGPGLVPRGKGDET
jgi:hypothetical protein